MTKLNDKILPKDVELFYDIFFNLLDFINNRDHVILSILPNIHSFTGQNSLEPAQINSHQGIAC